MKLSANRNIRQLLISITLMITLITAVARAFVVPNLRFQTNGFSAAYSGSNPFLFSQKDEENSWPSTSTKISRDPYSREVRLREEAESPFRRVRFFLYAALGVGAVTSLLLSLARIAAAASGINEDLMQESVTNAGVDLAGLVALGLLWQRDLKAEESRLKRATKGASLAKLAIRVNQAVRDPFYDNANKDGGSQFTSLTLADLRRDRGIEKRVVIAAAGKDKLDQILEEARAKADALDMTDLLLVPVVMPQATSPVIEATTDTEGLPDCVALPVGNAAWKAVLEDESQEALKQEVDIEREGFCIILKKNGRVGQRTRGIFLDRMIGEVASRKDRGMDVKNI